MLNFEFNLTTRVIFGRDAEDKIPEIIRRNGFKKVLLHTYDKEFADTIPVYKKVKKLLEDAGIEYVEMLGVEPNPTLAVVERGMEICRREGVDFILAVGGGSVIDSAKGIALGVHTSIEDVWAFAEGKKEPDCDQTLKVGVVLTAAAAGSETSTATVLTNEKLNLKRGAHHDANRPLFAVMNPEVTYTVPPFQTACGVFDSIMHACERYMTSSTDAALSDRVGEGIIKSVIEAGYEVMKNPQSYEARAAVMWGASMAHNNLIGCGRIKGSGIHLIEEEMHSVNPKIVHGAGLSVVFPSWARQAVKKAPMRLAQFANRIWNVDMDFEHPEKTAMKGIEHMEAFIDFLGLPRTMHEIGVKEEDFPIIVDQCTRNGRKVSQLCDFTPEDVMEILQRVK